MSLPEEVVIIGAGVFGLSTALALAKQSPSTKVHVVDRFQPPVPDGTSTDTTRCLRYDYVNKTYAALAVECMDLIKDDPEISPFFHQTGMTFVCDDTTEDKWYQLWTSHLNSIRSIHSPPCDVSFYNSPTDVFERIHGEPPAKDVLRWRRGYTNNRDGFIDAAKSMGAYYEKCVRNGVNFTFAEVTEIVYNDTTAKGVRLGDDRVIDADLVIVAAGAWSCKLVDLGDKCKSTGIEVAWFKVTKEEEEKWANMPITTNLSTGINIFPPYEGEIKCLRRSPGYKNTVTVKHPDPLRTDTVTLSYPRTIVSHPNDWIPKEAEEAIRLNLKEIMPSLSDRPFDRTKLCWLTQTKDSNFIIDFHPDVQNVLITTGGSAHAWKFAPILGDKVLDLLRGQLEPTLRQMWAWGRQGHDNSSAPRMEGEPPELSRVVRAVDKI